MIREVIITVLVAMILFLAIRAVAQNSIVDGSSMEPNMHNGQRIVVSKAAYWFSDPRRGDIVVFKRPHQKSSLADRLMLTSSGIIHRIVGLPGEEVEIKSGELYINGQKVNETYIQGHSISAPLQRIPEDSYFIVGDNRFAAASDIVPRKDIIGKVWLCYWPVSQWGLAPNHSLKLGVGE
ncbi:MAG: signal peptidase I [Dehalococcoidia bacterium]